jgi:hypothetical protein
MVQRKSLAIRLLDLLEYCGHRLFDLIFSAVDLACLWVWNQIPANNESRTSMPSDKDAKTPPDDEP